MPPPTGYQPAMSPPPMGRPPMAPPMPLPMVATAPGAPVAPPGYVVSAGHQPGGQKPPTVIKPGRVEPVPGTPYSLVYPEVPPIVCGPAVGSLVAGIGSIVVSLLVGC